jgi:hypothetical protein
MQKSFAPLRRDKRRFPKALREKFDIETPGEVFVYEADGRIVVEPVPSLERLHGVHASDRDSGEVLARARELDESDRQREAKETETILDRHGDGSVFDTEPLLAFLYREPGHETVADRLDEVASGETAGYLAEVNASELLYLIARIEGEDGTPTTDSLRAADRDIRGRTRRRTRRRS